jgi:hypothetical protein
MVIANAVFAAFGLKPTKSDLCAGDGLGGDAAL